MNELFKLICANKGKIGVGTYRAVLLAGVIWLNQSFVGKADYEADKKQQSETYQEDKKAQAELNVKVTATLTQIQTTLTLMSTQDERLRDHEQRLRALEKSSK